MAEDKLEKYKQLLINFLPPGKLWVVKNQPNFEKLLEATAQEFCRVDERAEQMQIEVDPLKTFEALDLWEKAFGLPDACASEDQSLTERRAQLKRTLTNVGGLSKTFYEFIVSQLGSEAEVTNRVNFVAGRARAGDPLTNYFNRTFVAGSHAGMQLREIGWRSYFNVELPATVSEHFVAGSVAGTPLRNFQNPLIECTIRELKPANAGVTFTFV